MTEGPAFQIGRTHVGPGLPAYVIAEAGVNHDGDVKTARQMIVAAAAAGADAIKFQVFAADRLVTKSAPSVSYQKQSGQGDSQHDMLSRLELSQDEFAVLANDARRHHIDFLCTPFSMEDLAFVASLGVGAIKLASTDIVNGPLLDSVAATKLPVIASTGAADVHEIRAALDRLRGGNGAPLALLHCVSSYPTPEAEANLGAIRALAATFGCVTGFSDHTSSVAMGGWAVAAGACIVEKHFTLDRHRPGPDHAFSLEPAALADYVRTVRHVAKVLGNGDIGPTERQREVRELARSSLVAACHIPADQIVSHEMLTAKRPGGGISPMRIAEVVGRRASRDMARDTQVTWDSLTSA